MAEIPWRTAIVPGCSPEGEPVLSVLAKGSWEFGPGSTQPAKVPLEIVQADTYENETNPSGSDVAAESDLTAWKVCTDVIARGRACAPRGRRVYHLDCTARVGQLFASVRVYGERRFKSKALGGLALGDPAPFESQPLGYRYAYGGVARTRDNRMVTCHTNPVGTGFILRESLSAGVLPHVPHLEDPACPLEPGAMVLDKYEKWPDSPRPCSLGWTRRDAFPRYTLAGVTPEFLPIAQKNAENLASQDDRFKDMRVPRMDYRFFQGASTGLYGGPLRGGEAVELTHFDSDCPVIAFELPSARPSLSLDIGDGPCGLEPVLHTVVIDADSRVLTMLWRGSLAYGGVAHLTNIRRMDISCE